MQLAHVITAIREGQQIQDLLTAVEHGVSPTLDDLPQGVKAPVIAAMAASVDRAMLVVCSREDRAAELGTAITEMVDAETPVIQWIAPEGFPVDRLPRDPGASAARVAAMRRLSSTNRPVILLATPAGLTHFLLTPHALAERILTLTVHDRTPETALIAWAIRAGYEQSPLVTGVGQFSRRGGIFDIFSPGTDFPSRIEFFGDDIESIRSFNATTQRSVDRLTHVELLPAYEVDTTSLPEAADQIGLLDFETLRLEVRDELLSTLDKMRFGDLPSSLSIFARYCRDTSSTLVDHFPENGIVVFDDPGALELAARQRERHGREATNAACLSGELPRGLKTSMANWASVSRRLWNRQSLALAPGSDSLAPPQVSLSAFGSAPQFSGRLQSMIESISQYLNDGWRITIATDQVERVAETLEAADLLPRRQTRRSRESAPLPHGAIEVIHSDLDGGWIEHESRSVLITDLELFGFRKRLRRAPSRNVDAQSIDPQTLKSGEFVVHIDHGVASFAGLTRVELNGVEREYILLEYARGDKLYVPVDQTHRVSRYASGGLSPELSKLGSGEWTRSKQRVRRAVREMAFELLNLYVSRETVSGFQFGPDTVWDMELADSFPYSETADQIRAIEDVRRDMESALPMDRLVCGDVGFGKTEVAIRAAFKAVNAGKQVAILVPTTILALQHLDTFSKRLAAFPVRIDMLSRLRSPMEQRKTVARLHDGSIDIVIGTHRLVQADIRFRDLGLVVIDEEQRFGVRQKEFLKQLRTEVDVIAMSATPIPRTLHNALAGIRDISIIDTPPQARLPIRTFVTDTSDHLLREVILREIDRGGQVFVVHNRVATIGKLAANLHRVVPEARIGIGHGQMDEDVLEQIMVDFIDQQFDVLVCTTIIESGVDIPNANTIVIDNADTLGLTQLYQLRGRVGRGANRAYAYLLVRPNKPLSVEAEARLEAIQEATELGAGLKLAMRDMEIRGAGNILGAEQSGHIGEVGYELYLRLLSQAVEEIKAGKPFEEQPLVTLDLPVTALIPASYLQDVELRLKTYRRIASINRTWEIDLLREELVDRFGPVPEEVERLFSLITLRIRCEQLGIESVVEREREIILRPVDTSSLSPNRLHSLLGPAVRFTPQSIRIRVTELEISWADAISHVLEAIEDSNTLASGEALDVSAPRSLVKAR
ncbi:transcription-repair coupling factor [soil metagenome]